ncbi:unnamed protein product [Penicillium salamii]|nr:unnamed protein product [Penicillium salamii]CAG8400223.1 unnamed protein product [Penicillium salamii]
MAPKIDLYQYQDAVESVKHGTPATEAAKRLLAKLDDQGRLSLLDGDDDFWEGFKNLFYDRFNRVPYVFGQIPSLDIPGIRFTDGPRGVVMGSSTAFPVPMARGATWDISLERRVGHAIGLEARAQGANFYSGVCINLPRHPAWGRSQEVYGEDPILLGEFGLALTQGVQRNIMACAKHFALNSMENARFKIDVQVDEDVLHEVYLPHFRRVVEGGVASIMSAYNSVNGQWAGQSEMLLNKVLRQDWKFDGFVISDFIWGLRDSVMSVKHGLDIETPFKQQRNLHLNDALNSGDLKWADIDRSCTRILSRCLQFAKEVDNEAPSMDVVFSEEHRALAREVAGRSCVLLKNDPVNGKPLLPISSNDVTTIALVGRLANAENTGDRGSSHVWSPHVVTIYEGIVSAFPHCKVVLDDTGSIETVKDVAKNADVVICVVGYTYKDEGEYAAPTMIKDPELSALFPPAVTKEEKDLAHFLNNAGPREKDKSDDAWKVGAGGDRSSLRLRPEDINIIEAATGSNRSTIVCVVSGSSVIMEEWKNKVPALLMSWYAGSEGGHGLADVLTNRVPPSGRLPFSVPKSESHLPRFDINATKISYDRWFGQALLDKLQVDAAYPLGFGLSYTTFTARNMHFGNENQMLDKEIMDVYATVKNTGSHRGRYVAQVYGCPGLPNFPSRLLLGFNAFDLNAGEEVTAFVAASLRPLQRRRDGRFILPRGKLAIEFASFSGDSHALRCFRTF